ncbi:phage receptor [Pseudomonas sp. CC6-YY-74]|uniref:NfrA family protein n=1 Tax=Pseudomonas sp. CC6-YY-74 TaxID=1930532 RepID=UPI0015A75999|nr:phage receptor [Pseudomonas sp. CC6-YY-74]
MPRHHRLGLLPLLLLGSWFAHAEPADGASELQNFRSFPFIDKAYKALQKDQPVAAEELARHVLEKISPNAVEARRILVHALLKQGRYADALEVASALPAQERAAQINALRIGWITSSAAPPAKQLEAWLQAEPDALARERLMLAYAQQLSEREGPPVAWAWLQAVPIELTPVLRRHRAVLAEQSGDWSAVIESLLPLQAEAELDAESWRRLGLAYAALGRQQGVADLLRQAPSPEDEGWLRLLLADRAVGQGHTRSAKELLLPLDSAGELDAPHRVRLLQLARDDGDVELAMVMADALHQPCLDNAAWLAKLDPPRARRELERCSAEAEPQRWLVLVEALQAEQLMARTVLAEPWDALRREHLLARWIARGDFISARAWLDAQPDSAQRSAQQAQLAQKMADAPAAATWWQRHYQATGDLRSADLASYLWMQTGQPLQARQLLERVQQGRRGNLPEPLLTRLVDLYGQARDIPSARLVTFRRQLPATLQGRLTSSLAAQGLCPRVQELAGDTPSDPLEWRALGQCSMPDQPGQAVVYLQAAVAAGDADSRGLLAYALAAAGMPAQAYELWSSFTEQQLDVEARLARTRVALASDQADKAEVHWQELTARTAEYWRLGASIADARSRPAEALARQRKVLELETQGGDYYRAGQLAIKAGGEEEGLQWLRRAAELEPDNGVLQSEYGLRMAASPTPELRATAIAPLVRASALQAEDFRLAEALAARYIEVGDKPRARESLRRAIDLEHAQLKVVDESIRDLQERRYAARRQHEYLQRRDSISLASTWSPDGVASAADQRDSGEFTETALWDHSLEDYSGKRLSVYGRLLGSGDGGPLSSTLGGGIGLRYVPFNNLNLNLSAELYREDFGVADNDLMLRATASFLDQGNYRNDWRPTQDSWPERSLYLDAAWWVDESERLLLVRYNQGQMFKLGSQGAQALGPYAMLQGTEQDAQQDVRLGAGLRWQLWFGATQYSAYRHRLALKVEYQQALGGTLYDGSNGWLLGVELAL